MLGIAAAGTAAGSIGISILLENTFETLGFARAIRACECRDEESRRIRV